MYGTKSFVDCEERCQLFQVIWQTGHKNLTLNMLRPWAHGPANVEGVLGLLTNLIGGEMRKSSGLWFLNYRLWCIILFRFLHSGRVFIVNSETARCLRLCCIPVCHVYNACKGLSFFYI